MSKQILSVIFAIGLCIGCSSEPLDQLSVGMTQAEVEAIIGSGDPWPPIGNKQLITHTVDGERYIAAYDGDSFQGIKPMKDMPLPGQ